LKRLLLSPSLPLQVLQPLVLVLLSLLRLLVLLVVLPLVLVLSLVLTQARLQKLLAANLFWRRRTRVRPPRPCLLQPRQHG
jgi:hypothetical protein